LTQTTAPTGLKPKLCKKIRQIRFFQPCSKKTKC
jgi:hypothetical protein